MNINMRTKRSFSTQCAAWCLIVWATIYVTSAQAREYKIPVAGNAFRTQKGSGDSGRRRGRGSAPTIFPGETYSVFFHVDKACNLDIRLTARALGSDARIVAKVDGEPLGSNGGLPVGGDFVRLGSVEVKQLGYVAVDLSLSVAHDTPVRVDELLVESDRVDAKLSYVRDNEGSMYYWGRRGPSVHLKYETPNGVKLRYAYSEVTVPEGNDPLGTFFMANGFGEGYFGFQVNSPTERRVLFSVWSPYSTNDPRKIPPDQRISLIAKGPGVRVGKFGNEGSGGQSFLVYPWQAGKTYRFLTEVIPDGESNTVYTSWFGDASENEWRLIASFSRPKTNTNLRGFHSFLESFYPASGYLERMGLYGNVWCADVDGNWYECTGAKFTVDATGRRGHRLDFQGGVTGNQFFLRNCGFFRESTAPDTKHLRSASGRQPEIQFKQLPR